jgi:hypothetical protein
MASMDMTYRKFFLKNEKPPLYYHNKAFKKQDILGYESLLKFYNNVHSLERTYNLLQRAIKQNKLNIILWLIKKEEESIDKDKVYFRRHIAKVIGNNFYILNGINDIISSDNVDKFKIIYNLYGLSSLNNLLNIVCKYKAYNIYKWLFDKVGHKKTFKICFYRYKYN